MSDWFTMERTVECANCGREGDLYVMEEARGFFWGQSSIQDNESTAEFLSLAYEALDDGYDIIYTSWW